MTHSWWLVDSYQTKEASCSHFSLQYPITKATVESLADIYKYIAVWKLYRPKLGTSKAGVNKLSPPHATD